MSSPGTARARWTRRRQLKRGRAAEERGFQSIYQRSKKNRSSQFLVLLGFATIFAGGSLMEVGTVVGLVLVILGVPLTLGACVWCFKNWDY